MTVAASPLAYHLTYNYSHLIDLDVDAWLVKFPGWENTLGLSSTTAYDLPERIEFDSVFDVAQTRDFLINDVRWPLLSKKAMNILSTVSDFPHVAFPIIILDSQVIFVNQGVAQHSGRESNNFVTVQLSTHLEALDWEQSQYEPSFILPDQVMSIQALVLKERATPFPPLFRLSAYPTALFVSSEARAALEQANCTGMVFRSIKDFRS